MGVYLRVRRWPSGWGRQAGKLGESCAAKASFTLGVEGPVTNIQAIPRDGRQGVMHKDRGPIRIIDPFVPDDRGEFMRLVSIRVDLLIDRRRFDLFQRLPPTPKVFLFGVFFLSLVNCDPQRVEHMVDLPEEGARCARQTCRSICEPL